MLRSSVQSLILVVLQVPWIGFGGVADATAFAEADSATATSGQDSRVTIHGYLSQTYGKTSGAQLLGFTQDGTTDYRDLALQFRLKVSERGTFMVQLSHERKGKSPTQGFHDDVEVDWAFYGHIFSSGTSIKVGRVPIPFGIYNEIRDVGTLLPFFAPPGVIYAESAFSSESVDGAVVRHEFFGATDWSLQVAAYFGGWTAVQRLGPHIGEARAENASGLQLWLDTPIRGLRFGLALQDYVFRDGVIQLNESDQWKAIVASIDAKFEHFEVQAEYLRRDVAGRVFGFPLPDLEMDHYYVQVGVKLTRRLSFHAIYEGIDANPNVPGIGEASFWEDVGAGLTFSFTPNLVLKAEHHDNASFFAETGSNNFLLDAQTELTYDIVTLSVSF